jgi:predicted  nucleic acid-binding Zn-ribbon protein
MRTSIPSLSLLLLAVPVAVAQPALTDAQLTQTLLSEIRQLRADLQSAAATIQRVQIVMYRLQSESSVLDRATQRFEQARGFCTQAEEQQRGLAQQIASAEEQARDASNPGKQQMFQNQLTQLKAAQDTFAREAQECQVERGAAETQLRIEQAKMSDLEGQLDRLDRILAGYTQK